MLFAAIVDISYRHRARNGRFGIALDDQCRDQHGLQDIMMVVSLPPAGCRGRKAAPTLTVELAVQGNALVNRVLLCGHGAVISGRADNDPVILQQISGADLVYGKHLTSTFCAFISRASFSAISWCVPRGNNKH